jgi:DNA-binding MarR family transcriptional regulator
LPSQGVSARVVDSLPKVVAAGNISEPNAEVTSADVCIEDRQDEMWRLLLSVHGRLLARLDQELRRGHGLSLAEYEVLVALSDSDGSLRMTELAQRMTLSPSGLTRRVDRLVARGLVTRRSCPSDGRGSLAALTAAGRADLRRAAPTHASGVRRYLVDPVSTAGLQPLADGLEAVDRALGSAEGVDGPARKGRRLRADAATSPR